MSNPARQPATVRARQFFACALLVCWWLLGLASCLAQDSISKEYQIKAAYLYNFAKFVEWPAESFTNSQAPLVIGVFGANPFGEEFKQIAKDHKINGRDILFKPVVSITGARGVHMIFFGAAEDGQITETLAAFKNIGVLTVGESDKFFAAGGVINFVREADKVRFEVNATAAEQQRLKISAQLLKLAKTIRKEP